MTGITQNINHQRIALLLYVLVLGKLSQISISRPHNGVFMAYFGVSVMELRPVGVKKSVSILTRWHTHPYIYP